MRLEEEDRAYGASTIINGIVILLILLILAAVLWPVYTGSGGASPRTYRLSQAKQLATGVAIYMGDSNDVLPPVVWRPGLVPYTKNPALFEDRKGKTPYIFAYRASLASVVSAKIPDQADRVMILDVFESSDPFVAELPALAFREGKGSGPKMATIGFVDGHARAMNPTLAAKLR